MCATGGTRLDFRAQMAKSFLKVWYYNITCFSICWQNKLLAHQSHDVKDIITLRQTK